MTIYLFISLVTIFIFLIFYYFESLKAKVFDNYLNLNVYVSFSDNKKDMSKSRQGFLLLDIQELRGKAEALYINQVKLHGNKLQLRSFNGLYTKVPIPVDGVTLSVGVRRKGKSNLDDLENMYVTISGAILNDKNQKIPFKKKLPISKFYSPKMIPVI